MNRSLDYIITTSLALLFTWLVIVPIVHATAQSIINSANTIQCATAHHVDC